MSLDLRRCAEIPAVELAALEKAMTAFYTHPPASYYQIADHSSGRYTPEDLPFHCDLVSRVEPGMKVLEMGCGTAHLCPYVKDKGGHYTGMDHGEELLQANQKRFPQARFVRIGTPVPVDFDIVASLCTLEHVANPPAYLEQMWRQCRPGGLLAIFAPEFIEDTAFPPSLFYGRTPRRLREKLAALDFRDAWQHLLDLKIRQPRWHKRALANPPGAFWINLRPRILHGADYTVDADAIHISRLKDWVWFFEKKGAQILQTSKTMPGVSPAALRFNGYLIARKPAA